MPFDTLPLICYCHHRYIYRSQRNTSFPHPNNIQKISEGHQPAFVLTDADTFANGEVTLATEEGESTFDYAMLALATSVEMRQLQVKSAYTTTDEESSSKGAVTLTCEKDGVTVYIRTAPLYDENGALITEDAYLGKTIDVKGIVDYYDGNYQIKVLTRNGITIHP